MAAVSSLTVLYDPHCGLCREARAWLEAQTKFVPLVFVGAGTELAARRFPTLDHRDTLRQLTVVSDRGGVYRGACAWLMVLWALREWRDRAITLGWAPLRPLVGLGVWLISTFRRTTRCEGSCGTGHLDLERAARAAGASWDARQRGRAGGGA